MCPCRNQLHLQASCVNVSSSSNCSVQKVKSLTWPFPFQNSTSLLAHVAFTVMTFSPGSFPNPVLQNPFHTKARKICMEPEKEHAFPVCKSFQAVLITRSNGPVHVYLLTPSPPFFLNPPIKSSWFSSSALSEITGYRILSSSFTWRYPMVEVFILSSAVTFLMWLMLKQQNKTKLNCNEILMASVLLTVLFI